MSRETNELKELDLPFGQKSVNGLSFRALYDRYAPTLFGVIAKTVLNEDEAVDLLEKTFATVHAELNRFQPEKQPVFAWLLTIARKTMADALQTRSKVPYPVGQLTSTGKVTHSAIRVVPADGFRPDSTDSHLKELLDSVLFKKCTPEEAARTIGIPVESARQQLRLAMQQLRS